MITNQSVASAVTSMAILSGVAVWHLHWGSRSKRGYTIARYLLGVAVPVLVNLGIFAGVMLASFGFPNWSWAYIGGAIALIECTWIFVVERKK